MQIEFVTEFTYKDKKSFLKSKRYKNYIKKNNYFYELADYFPDNKPKCISVYVYKLVEEGEILI